MEYGEYYKNLHDQIMESAPETPKIHESTFKNMILPLIDTDENPKLDAWFAVAGRPHQVIDVFDDKTELYLFTVPPILTTLPEIEDEGQLNSVNAILTEFEAMRTSQHPAQGDLYLLHELTRRLERPEDQELVKALYLWKIIDDRYSLTADRFKTLKRLTAANVAGVEQATTHDKANDGTGEFEDL